jgi:hypothetical protein
MRTSRVTVVTTRAGAVLTAVVFAAVIALTIAPGAGAQEPGVHVDPGSPTGKEYAIPLAQARGDAAQPQHGSGGSSSGGSSSGGSSSGGSSSGGSSSGGSSTAGSVAFGQGVTQAGGNHGSPTARPVTRRRTQKARRRPKPSADAPRHVSALPAASDIGGGADMNPVILALGVLAAGGVGGLAVRALVRQRA